MLCKPIFLWTYGGLPCCITMCCLAGEGSWRLPRGGCWVVVFTIPRSLGMSSSVKGLLMLDPKWSCI